MDKDRFMQVIKGAQKAQSPEEFSEAVRRQLAGSRLYHYHEVPGEGYALCGVYHGVGFAQVLVRLVPGNMIEVVVDTGLHVKPSSGGERSLRKLLHRYSSQFRLRGLILKDGTVQFKSRPIDPLNGRFDIDEAVGLALSTVHAYAGVPLALDAGVSGWKLLGYGAARGMGEDDDEGDDDDGEILEAPENMESLADLLEIFHEGAYEEREETKISACQQTADALKGDRR